ncbi:MULTISPECIES: GAP1-N2 domain-containing protein [Rhodococcus]|uniref:GAP1-N2 domain-containing protein n=1 Tax=Rhodococcus TaxID=1827 RepID=UPI001E3ED435|nr:hypothetical protein [Rhodococcus pyridinivorans]MCD2116723.1 hypothetical protein [Rhodococcus pyridinivorans]MCZ4625333.1 hypothetical protein [Rhodococcus pyridinivorans]MCZ4646543.1 hypothetical protein [Rhodococcus pyridinivorans]MDJ0482381.1 hypothetical protein [Rhodococcus pyridinivorans]MDV7252904.1 hypothetical protein [Rhodococcus pyridinivorans]
MTAEDAERPRFGQLTYTSFDRPGTASGGWQVKDISGDLDRDEKELLRTGIVTRFEAIPPVPRFPSVEELRERPRRLMYAKGPGKTGLYWHTVPAGADASGRPGNVFVHSMIDRSPRGSSLIRAIERWRSPGWLTPYGADEVATSNLGSVEPAPTDLTSRDAVLDFLLEPSTWRIGIFSVLLDAVGRALAGGPPVVLGCRDTDRAAHWIAAVSHFMSPGTCRRFGWSTFDRLHAVDDAVAGGAHLIAVPLDDLPGDTPGCVVFGELESPDLGELDGEPHCVANGDLVPVGPWSLLAQTVLVDADVARRALARQDEIAREVGDDGLAPMWPLAMAVVADGELHDALDEATTVLLEQSPAGVLGTDLASLIFDVVDPGLGETAEDAVHALGRWVTDDALAAPVRELATRIFAHRAFDDHAWLSHADPSRRALFEHCVRTPDLAADAEQRLLDLRARTHSGFGHTNAVVEALRVLDAILRADLVGARGAELVFEILELGVVPILCDPAAGSAVVAEVGRVGETPSVDYLQPAVVTHLDFFSRPLGRRLDPSVFRWLMSSLEEQPPFDELAHDLSVVARPVCILVAEGVFALTAEGNRVRSELATIAVWRAFSEINDGSAPVEGLDQVVAALNWTAGQWRRMVEAYPRVVAPRYLMNLVVGERWSTDVDVLARHVIGCGDQAGLWRRNPAVDELAVSWAAIRRRENWRDVTGYVFDHAWQTHGAPVLDDYRRCWGPRLAADLLARIAVLTVGALARSSRHASTLADFPPDHVDALADAVAAEPEYVVNALAELVDSGAVEPDWLVANAVLSSPQSSSVPVAVESPALLKRFVIGTGSESRGLLDDVVSSLFPMSRFGSPARVKAALRSQFLADGHRDADRLCDAYAAFVVWWFDRRLADAEREASRPRGSI